MSKTVNSDPTALLLGKTRSGILRLLFERVDEKFYLSQIIHRINTGHGAVQRELKQLVAIDLVNRCVDGHRVYYQANTQSLEFSALAALFALKTGIEGNESFSHRVRVPAAQFVEFCRRYHIRRLAFFGSVLRPDFTKDSDIDVLVEFERGHVPGFGIIAIEDELSEMLGRKVDLRTPGDLSRHFRDEVVQEAKVIYAAR